jgi:hypothetical protein
MDAPGSVIGKSRSIDRVLASIAVLAGIVFSIALVLHAHAVNGRNGFPLDDPWIHLTYARNLHDYHTFAYFPGDPSTQGSTSPLYTFLLSLGFAVTRNEKLLSYALGVIFQALFLVTFQAWAHRQLGSRAWAAAATLITGLAANIGILSVSGMETSLFLFTMALAFLARLQGRHRTLGIALALAVWTRPDGLILVMAFALDSALALPAGRKSWRAFLAAAVPLAALLLAYAVFNVVVGGKLLPSTFAAKTAFYRHYPRSTFITHEVAQLFLGGAGLLLVPFAVFSTAREAVRLARWKSGGSGTGRSLRAETAWTIGVPLAYLLFMPFAHRFQRYLVPVLPSLVILGLSGMQALAAAGARLRGQRLASPETPGRRTTPGGVAAAAIVAAAIVLHLIGTVAAAKGYAELCDYHWLRHERTGRWLAQNTPPTAVVAAHDVGAIAFYSGRKVVDIMGVVLPEVVAHVNTPGYFGYLGDLFARERVTHLAVLRNWIEVTNVEPLFTADPRPEVLDVFPWTPGQTHLVPTPSALLEGRALETLRKGDAARASGLLRQALAIDPENSRAWFLAGVAQQTANRPGDAESSFRRALALFPEFADAQLRLASILAAAGRPDEARAILTALLERKPDDPGAAGLLKRIGE